MSYHPESEDGFTEGLNCPYCDSDDIEYTGDTRTEFGVCMTYEITEGVCNNCGKKVEIIEEVITEVYGCCKPHKED